MWPYPGLIHAWQIAATPNRTRTPTTVEGQIHCCKKVYRLSPIGHVKSLHSLPDTCRDKLVEAETWIGGWRSKGIENRERQLLDVRLPSSDGEHDSAAVKRQISNSKSLVRVSLVDRDEVPSRCQDSIKLAHRQLSRDAHPCPPLAAQPIIASGLPSPLRPRGLRVDRSGGSGSGIQLPWPPRVWLT